MRYAVGTLLLFITLVLSAQQAGYNSNSKPGFDPDIKDVSMVQLIANPQAYDIARVRLIGYLRLEFEGDAVYLHREDFDNQITKNGIWVNVPRGMTEPQQEAVNNQYVICEGRFVATRHGHMGMFSGELTDVKRLERWFSRSELNRAFHHGADQPETPK